MRRKYDEKLFSDEQLERASSIDLVSLLKNEGEKLKKQGYVHRWMRYDSTIIYGNKWYRHSRGIGGGPIQFMQHFYGKNFVEAVKYLLDGEEGAVLVAASNEPEPKPEFKQPKLSANMHRTFAYLIKTRKIDADVVQFFVNEKKIQETEEYHNVAFCGYDEDGVMKQMHLRSTIPGNRFFLDVEGSDKKYYFRHDGTNADVYVFEAPIDMLSYITLNKENWQESTYVCLGGVAVDALLHAINLNPKLENIYLCVDNDEAGEKTVKRIKERLEDAEFNIVRKYSVLKDWNEDLISERTQEENISMTM